MAELPDKSSVITNKSKETSDIFRVGIFIDDVIIFCKTYEEHLDNLRLVFDRIRQYNMKLAPAKCSFFTRKVKYVGHVVSEAGVWCFLDFFEVGFGIKSRSGLLIWLNCLINRG
jgi:hypothetical protein